jgi:hypothetical protein
MKKTIAFICVAALLYGAGGKRACAMGLALSRQVPATVLPAPDVIYTSLFNRLVDKILGVRLIFDTTVAKDRLFNYRISVDCHNELSQKEVGYSNLSYYVNHLMVTNSFGFGFIRTPLIRVWAGPQLTLEYEFKNMGSKTFDPIIYNMIGPVVGLNLNAGNDMTFALEMGLRTGFGFDIGKSPAHSLVASRPEPVASLKLIFRSWDN